MNLKNKADIPVPTKPFNEVGVDDDANLIFQNEFYIDSVSESDDTIDENVFHPSAAELLG